MGGLYKMRLALFALVALACCNCWSSVVPLALADAVGRRAGGGTLSGALSLSVGAGSNTAGNDEALRESLSYEELHRTIKALKTKNKELGHKNDEKDELLARTRLPEAEGTKVQELGSDQAAQGIISPTLTQTISSMVEQEVGKTCKTDAKSSTNKAVSPGTAKASSTSDPSVDMTYLGKTFKWLGDKTQKAVKAFKTNKSGNEGCYGKLEWRCKAMLAKTTIKSYRDNPDNPRGGPDYVPMRTYCDGR